MEPLRSMLANVSILVLLCVAACTGPPVVTTQEERDTATVFLNSSKTALLALHQSGDLKLARLELALSQIDRFKKRIDDSAEVPISWPVLWSDLTTFATEWALPPPRADPEERPLPPQR